MEEQPLMYVTKHCLSQGILKTRRIAWSHQTMESPVSGKLINVAYYGRFTFFVFGKEVFSDYEEAINHAEEMRLKALKAAHRRIHKLEAIDFRKVIVNV